MFLSWVVRRKLPPEHRRSNEPPLKPQHASKQRHKLDRRSVVEGQSVTRQGWVAVVAIPIISFRALPLCRAGGGPCGGGAVAGSTTSNRPVGVR